MHAYYADRYAYDNFVVASLYCRYEGKQYNEILTSANFNTITPPWMWIYIFDSAFKRNDSSVDRVIAAAPSYEYSSDINEIIFKRSLPIVSMQGMIIGNYRPHNHLLIAMM